MDQPPTRSLDPEAVLYQADQAGGDGTHPVSWENLREALREALRRLNSVD